MSRDRWIPRNSQRSSASISPEESPQTLFVERERDPSRRHAATPEFGWHSSRFLPCLVLVRVGVIKSADRALSNTADDARYIIAVFGGDDALETGIQTDRQTDRLEDELRFTIYTRRHLLGRQKQFMNCASSTVNGYMWMNDRRTRWKEYPWPSTKGWTLQPLVGQPMLHTSIPLAILTLLCVLRFFHPIPSGERIQAETKAWNWEEPHSRSTDKRYLGVEIPRRNASINSPHFPLSIRQSHRDLSNRGSGWCARKEFPTLPACEPLDGDLHTVYKLSLGRADRTLPDIRPRSSDDSNK